MANAWPRTPVSAIGSQLEHESYMNPVYKGCMANGPFLIVEWLNVHINGCVVRINQIDIDYQKVLMQIGTSQRASSQPKDKQIATKAIQSQ